MQNIVKLQFSVFTVFKPFLSRLITTNVKLPSDLRNIVKILCVVDVHFSFIIVTLSGVEAWFADNIIAVYCILCNIIFKFLTFQQMYFTDFSALFYQISKSIFVFWISNS